jgi:hypothetical protein
MSTSHQPTTAHASDTDQVQRTQADVDPAAAGKAAWRVGKKRVSHHR